MRPVLPNRRGVTLLIKGNGWVKELEIYIDGASKGNPGPSGIGIVICRDGQTIGNLSSYIGTATNNIAEYTALICALQEALKLKAESVKIKTDSQLLCRQINRIYRIKNPGIAGLYNQAQHLMPAFKKISVDAIPREENRGADKLATKAIKDHLKKHCSLKAKHDS